MAGLLSAISGQFTKSLILGSLLPAAIFVMVWLGFVAPLLPPGFSLPALDPLGVESSAVAIVFATSVIAVLLHNLDIPLIRLYEGYPWKDSPLGRLRTRAQRRTLAAERRRAALLFELTARRGTAGFRRLVTHWGEAQRRALEFPDRESGVLPTRLGNVLRAFERYPSVQYEIDAIHFWPRLIAVIPGDYAAAIGEARTSFVFLLNTSFLFAVLSASTTLAGLVYLPPGVPGGVLLPAAAFALLSLWLYRTSLGSAAAWGELVKGAFDLYRWELLKKLGYDQQPRTREAERALWRQITQQLIFGDRWVDLHRREPRVAYASAAALSARTSARAEPDGMGLQVLRAVEAASRNGTLRVVVEVTNDDEEGRTATGLVVTDTLPEGMEYVANSAGSDRHDVRVSGINPYHFHLGELPHGSSVVLTYSAWRAEPIRSV